MQCITPMYFVYNEGEKSKGKIVSRELVRQSLDRDGNFIKTSPLSGRKWMKVPCKHCWACQLNYSAEWATRIMLEAKETPNNWFITLTYDDEHVPKFEELNVTYKETTKEKPTTGKEWWLKDGSKYKRMWMWDPSPEKVRYYDIQFLDDGNFKYSLYPDDVTAFLKSLRKHFERLGHTGIKVFYCGEYGNSTERPHYHMILMNCPLDPKKFYSPIVDPLHSKAHWKSKELEKYWSKGYIDVAELEWSCAAYVARYCTKKLTFDQDKEEIYYSQGRLPEFIRMSKGIGKKYFETHKDQIYHTDEIIMKTVQGNTGSYKPPKVFDRWMEKLDPDFIHKIKISREKAGERAEKIEKELSDYTDLKRLQMKTENLNLKMNMLPREM